MAENMGIADGISEINSNLLLPTNAEESAKQKLSKPLEKDGVKLTWNINKTRKRLIIDDSDSDEGTENGNENETKAMENEVDSQSDNDELKLPEDSSNKGSTFRKSRLKIVDSDSEDSNLDISVHNKSSTDIVVENEQSPPEIFTTNSRGELLLEKLETTQQKSKLSGICDSESSEDENVEDSPKAKDEQMDIDEEESIAPILYKRKSSKKGEKQPKKMTPKQAAELRRETLSESQRMLRETNISLPYHKPKSFTLKEFLSRRPQLSSAVPVLASTPPSVAIKLCAEKLDVISKKLEEREKEVKKFYKSESESDDGNDDDEDYVPEDGKVDDEPASNVVENVEDNVLNENVAPAEDGERLNVDAPEKNNEPTEIVDDASSDAVRTDINSTESVNVISDAQSEDKCADSASKAETVVTEIISDDTNNEAVDDNAACIAEDINGTVVDNTAATIPDDINGAVGNSSNFTHDITAAVSDSEKIADNFNDEVVVDDASETTEALDNADAGHIDDEKQCVELKQVETQDSEAFDFSLDDIDDSTEQHCDDIEDAEMEKAQSSGHEEQVKSVEDGGVVVKDSSVENNKKVSNLELLKEKLANIQPRLSGGPNDVIDLDEGVTKPNEISKLMERFVKHTTTKKNPTHKNNKVQLSVVSVDGGEIHKETLAMSVDDTDEKDKTIEEKPGAKLAKLRVDLQQQMAQRRSELWKQKMEEQKEDEDDEENDVYDGEKSVCGDEADEDALLDDDDDDEENDDDVLDTSEEEFLDEIDKVAEMKRAKTKNAFVDDEADVSDEGGDEQEDGDDELDEDVGEKDIVVEDEERGEMECDADAEETTASHLDGTPRGKRKLRRIVKGFEDDSDDELDKDFDDDDHNKENIGASPEDDEITCHQPQKSVLASRSLSDIEFLTPVSYITGIQNLNNSASKSKISPFRIPNVPSPLKDNNWHSDLQKKLFQNSEISNTQAQAISELCSGQFSSDSQNLPSETSQPALQKSPISSEETSFECSAPPTTQDVLGICSGEFTGTSQVLECSEDNLGSANKMSSTTVIRHTINPCEEIKSLDEEQGLIISQLLDEEGMENFKKKFESPVMTETQRRIVEKFEEHFATGGVIDSDDEDADLEVKRKRKQKKLQFSDDDESSDEKEDVEEEIDLHDDVDDDFEDVEVDNIGYDSEENEIELVHDEHDEDAKKQQEKVKTRDFFENEAELSESEWGSADEDEKDLDKFEAELGDNDKFDEYKVRSDLEKIHLRHMLDDDNREVKNLQEFLLEDGELHGTGRERQFRWRNINAIDATEGADGDIKDDDDNVYLDDEESEEQWRKRRHEREMFLKEKTAKSQAHDDYDDGSVLIDSQLLKIGHEVMKTSQKMIAAGGGGGGGGSSCQESQEKDKSTAADATSPIKYKSSFTLLSKRGSFLSRGEEVLQRLSVYNKVTETVAIGATAKNSRNFLFQTVSVNPEANKDKKRKADVGTPKNLKKLRLSDNLSPADAVKKKSSSNTSAKSKLLWNLTD